MFTRFVDRQRILTLCVMFAVFLRAPWIVEKMER